VAAQGMLRVFGSLRVAEGQQRVQARGQIVAGLNPTWSPGFGRLQQQERACWRVRRGGASNLAAMSAPMESWFARKEGRQ
jgi:hypothetical protein